MALPFLAKAIKKIDFLEGKSFMKLPPFLEGYEKKTFALVNSPNYFLIFLTD